jgi:hypothetical protein
MRFSARSFLNDNSKARAFPSTPFFGSTQAQVLSMPLLASSFLETRLQYLEDMQHRVPSYVFISDSALFGFFEQGYFEHWVFFLCPS